LSGTIVCTRKIAGSVLLKLFIKCAALYFHVNNNNNNNHGQKVPEYIYAKNTAIAVGSFPIRRKQNISTF